MILTKWQTAVGFVVQAENHPIALSCQSPIALQDFLMTAFCPQKHTAALMVKFADSTYVLFLETPRDVPMRNVRDPDNGRFLIKYDMEPLEDKTSYVFRIVSKDSDEYKKEL